MRPLEGRTVGKNEKFCSTRQQVVCDKRKPAFIENEPVTPNSCFNYENITYHLSMLSRDCAHFACAISRCATNISGRRRSRCGGSRGGSRDKSRRSSCDESWRGGCDKSGRSSCNESGRASSKCPAWPISRGSGDRCLKSRSRK